MTPSLTFKDFLAKHCPDYRKRGNVKMYAAEHGVSTKQFSRWMSGATTPGAEQAILLLQQWGELRKE